MSEARPQILPLPVDEIALDPDQPRRRFPEETIEALAASLRASAVLQPVTVTRHARPDVNEPYLLLFGARRFLAARRAGLAEIPAILREEELSPAARILLQLTENDQREDLTLLDRSLAYARAVEASGLTDIDFAAQAGISRSLLSRYLWLTRSDGFLREALEADLLRHLETARLFSRLPPAQQLRLLRTARRTGEPITRSKVHRASSAAEAMLAPDLAELEIELSPGDLSGGEPRSDVLGMQEAGAVAAVSPAGHPTGVPAAIRSLAPDLAAEAPASPADPPPSQHESAVLVSLPLPALRLLLERLGLTPTPDPDEAVRCLLGALLVGTSS